MMKSFFKKLAFVMALAMVVTMAAPAGTAALAADLYVAYQGKTEAITEVTLEKVGDKADLCFKNAPKNWKDDFSWTSADTTVATVDEAGVIVAKKVGTTVVTCQVLGEEVDVKVTVGKVVETDAEYEVKQLTAATFAIDFAGAHNYKAGDVKLYFVLEGDGENYNVVWPIKDPKVTDTGFEVEPYVPFEDGNTYIVTLGNQKPEDGYEFTTEFGYPDSIDLSVFKSNNKEGKAFVTPEDANDDILTMFDIKLMSGDVDVTALYMKDREVTHNDAELEFSIEWSDNEDEVEIDDETGSLVFTKAGVSVIVGAKFTVEGDNGEPVVATGVTTTPITSENAPAYKVTNVSKWTIVKEGATKIDWNKCVHDIKALDDTDTDKYKIVALVNDNYGYTTVTDATFADPTNAYGFGKIYSPITGDTLFVDGEYQIVFSSADVSKLLVGKDGSLTTYVEADVPVIVSLYQDGTDDEDFVKHVSALPVEVEEARYIDKISAGAKSVDVVTAAFDEDFCEGKIEISLKDQHGDTWTKATTIAIKTDIETVGFSNGAGGTITEIPYTYNASTGKGVAELYFYGDDLKGQMGTEDELEVTFSVLVNAATGKKETCEVTIELVDPDTVWADTNEDGIEEDTGAIYIDGFGLTVTDANQKWTENNLVPTENKITFSRFSNGMVVGIEADVELYSATAATNKEYTVANGYTEGDKFLMVLDPNGNVVSGGTASTLGVYQDGDGVFHVVVAAVKSGNEIEYLATGEYTAKVINIKGFDDKTGLAEFRMKNGTGSNKVHTATFEVTNDSKTVTFVTAKKNVSEKQEIKQVVVDTLTFNLGGDEWKNMSVADIANVRMRYNQSAGYVIITSVDVKVPIDGKMTGSNGQYRVVTVNVNKAIELTKPLAGN